MRVFWLILAGVAIGVLAVFFALHPSLLNPSNLLTAAINFFSTRDTHPPAYYLKLIYGLGAIALVASAASLGLLAWVTKLEKLIRSQDESIFDLRSQISELLKNHKKH